MSFKIIRVLSSIGFGLRGGKELKSSNRIVLLIFIGLCLVLLFMVKSQLNNKVIGRFDRSGLYGEIVMEENIFYNLKKGNALGFFKTDFFNYPAGENLGFRVANSFHLFMCIPLKLFLSQIESYNTLSIIIFLLNFFAAYVLAKYLFFSKPVAFCSALIFTMNSYVFLKMNLGFNQKCALFWLPLYCLFLFKLQNTKRWRYALGAGSILTLMQLTYPPYAYFAAIFTVLLSSYSFLKHEELRFAFSRLFFILTLHFTVSSFIYYLMGFGFVYFKPYQVDVNTTLDGSLDLFRPFRFFPYYSPDFPTELPLGVSISALVLGIAAFIKNKGLPRLMLIIFLFFLVIAAGPYLTHKGNLVYILRHKVALPYYFMAKYLPFTGGIFYPIRVFPFINICLAISAGYGILYFSLTFKRIKILLVAILFSVIYLLEQVIFFPQLFPPKLSDVRIPKFYQDIKNEDSELILNLPFSSKRTIINRYGYYAVLSGKRMMNSFVKNKLQIYLPENTDNEHLKKEFIEFLTKRKVDYVVVHEYFLAKDTNNMSMNKYSWLEKFCYSENYPEDELLIYKIPSADKSNGT